MKYIEKTGDLFEEKNCFYAHCISKDFIMKTGIAAKFDVKYNMIEKLKNRTADFPKLLRHYCIQIDNVFNLIVKEEHFEKPTYKSLKRSLKDMKKLIIAKDRFNEFYKKNNIDEFIDDRAKRLVLPLIGCGHDRLRWEKVSEILKELFEDIDIEIIVYTSK